MFFSPPSEPLGMFVEKKKRPVTIKVETESYNNIRFEFYFFGSPVSLSNVQKGDYLNNNSNKCILVNKRCIQ